jgi:hypothetical protein
VGHSDLTRLHEENDMTAQTDTQGSVTTVSGEIWGPSGVTSVKAVASTGEVTVVSAAPLDDEAVRAAVDEAGFEFAGQA